VEFARNYVPFGGFPWLLIGYSQTEYLRVIQVSDLLGVYGVSFLVLWINTALGWAICLRDEKPVGFVPLTAGVILFLACVAYGESSLQRWRALDPGLWAALLQGNISFDDPEPELTRKFQDGYVKMAGRLPESKIDLLVLPESPSPLLFQQNTSYRETMERLARRHPLGMILSNVSVSTGPGGELYFNSAYFLDGDGKEIGRYDKLHLVPFGEYIPWRNLFFFAQTITKDVGDFQPGESYRLITMGGYRVNALICFEAVFPNLTREFVRRGSNLIVNLTNDGWYGDSSAPYQHLAMARWRAVENRRYLIRAANSGFSAIVNPTGELQARTGLLREEICEGKFTFIEERTWYSRHGDVFAILCVIITCLVSAMAIWKEWIGAKSRVEATQGGQDA
jgi:apolipoprotein N-acyltransferase